MTALDVARVFIAQYGKDLELTNLKINKLLYFAQVESLRQRNLPLFDDSIEAWQYGPVIPSVYHEFKHFGREVITSVPCIPHLEKAAMAIVAYVASTYGRLTAFDLVALSHRQDGAWNHVYNRSDNNVITVQDIVSSIDYQGVDGIRGTLRDGIEGALNSIPNALKMLENS